MLARCEASQSDCAGALLPQRRRRCVALSLSARQLAIELDAHAIVYRVYCAPTLVDDTAYAAAALKRRELNTDLRQSRRSIAAGVCADFTGAVYATPD